MNYCEIKDTQKGLTLQQMSGLPEFDIISYIKGFETTYGRFPELDEIPEANSEEYLNKQLNIKFNKDTKYTNVDNLKKATNTFSVREANAVINKEHPDLEVKIHQLGDAVIVDTQHRPSEYNEPTERKEIDFDGTQESNSIILREALDNLLKYYGANIIPVTTYELAHNPEFEGISSQNQAFIKNGTIYVNTDVATVDAPIHEQLHLFLGSIRYSNPNLYFGLVQSTEQLPNFESYILEFPNRTISDVQEEIFVSELAKFVTGQNSLLTQLPPINVNKLMYYIKRDIDSIIFGKQSVKSLSRVFDKSLLELAKRLNSDRFDVDTAASLDDATIHRIAANTKELLIKNNELIQDCG